MQVKITYLFTFAAVLVLTLAGAALARTHTLTATKIDPGAVGTVNVKAETGTDDIIVELKVDHLARPKLLTPAASEYVVWLEPEDGQPPQNEGVLKIGANEKGGMKIVTNVARFQIVITAETDPNPQHPSDRVVLHGEVAE